MTKPAAPQKVQADAAPGNSSRRRMVLLLGLLSLVVAFAVGLQLYRGRGAKPPEVPEFDVTGADPEVVKAVAAAREEVLHKPKSADAWGKLALVLHAHTYRDQAAHCYAVAAELDPKNPSWHYLHGIIIQEGREPQAAAPYFERAASRLPANSTPRLRLADMLLELGRLDEAEAEFVKVLSAEPTSAHAHFGMGQLAAARKQYQNALVALQQVAQDPHVRRRACALRAAAYEHLGDSEGASRESQQLKNLPEDRPWPDEGLELVDRQRVGVKVRLQDAEELLRRKQVPQAVEALKDVVRRYPDSHQGWASLGIALSYAGDPDNAERAMHQSVSLNPQRMEYWSNLGIFQMSQRRFEEAAKTFRKTIELRPTHAPSHFSLAEALRELGDLEGAAEEYRQTLRYAPDHEPARERLQSLESK